MKPCPFCGKDRYLRVIDLAWEFGDRIQDPMHVQCLGCGALGPQASTAESAQHKWNNRITEILDLPDDAKD